jgi:hypothetical protein
MASIPIIVHASNALSTVFSVSDAEVRVRLHG